MELSAFRNPQNHRHSFEHFSLHLEKIFLDVSNLPFSFFGFKLYNFSLVQIPIKEGI